jgi:pimeloyl-ACP methyl ester carboxylesterase
MIRTFTTIALLFCSQLFAQNKPITLSTDFNFGFENGAVGQLPPGWVKAGEADLFNIGITTADKHGGNNSLLIENKVDVDSKAAISIVNIIPAKYIGKQIELRAYLKFKDVTNPYGLTIRILDAYGQQLQLKTLQTKRISGTVDWQLYSVKVFLQPDAQTIQVGASLNGSGKIWVDDMQLLIDDKDISEAKIDPDYDPTPPKHAKFGDNLAASGRVRLKDADLYYETYGSGEPLLLLHGNSQMIYAFIKQIPHFEKKYKVIAVDTRGQGKSKDFSTGLLSYDLFADDMKQLMDSLHIKKANILGWSDGGNTGLVMAVKYPQYVNKLAVMGANLFPGTDALPQEVLSQVKAGIAQLSTRADDRSKMQVRLFTMLLNEPHLTFADMKTVKAPTLVLAGETDMILETHTRAIAAAIPKSEVVIFKGASHYAPVEIVREFNETVSRFFEKK